MYKTIYWILIFILSANVFAEDLTAISSFQLGPRLKQLALVNKSNSQVKIQTYSQLDPNFMYDEIYQYINGREFDLGKKLAENVLKLNRGFDLGKQNFNGLTWQKPFANFSIGINRQLSPDLFDDKTWIVDDTFTITIDAATYLTNLKDAKDIIISDSQLASFVGMSFKRTFRYIHFSQDYTSGLTSDYNKLFMSFWKMRKGDIFNLEQYEIISREDSMSFKAGAFISSPPAIGAVVNGGILASMTKLSKVQIQSIGPLDNPKADEYLRISSEKEKIMKVEAETKLQADFFKLLKITLLSFDTDYSFDEIDRKYYSFKKSDIKTILSNNEATTELNDLINLKKLSSNKISLYEVQGEYRKEENFGSKYSIFLFGGETTRGSQTIMVNNGQESKTFVVHKSKTIRFTENVGSKLAGIVLAAMFQSDILITQYFESLTRDLEIEFEAARAALDGNQIDQIKEIKNSDQLSFKVVKEYKTRKAFKKLKDWKKSKEFEQTLSFINKLCKFDSPTITSLENGELQSPLSITSTLRIEKNAIIHFNNLAPQSVLDTLKDMCRVSESVSASQDYCYKMLEGKYLAYITPFNSTKKIQILKLKDFLYSFNNQYDDIGFYKRLFGEDLVFFSGQLEATRKNGLIFTTYFHDGDFRGLGVIDNYLRKSGTAMPAPIYNYLE